MRCETARTRFPDDRAERHTASCVACRAWHETAARVRVLATVPFTPVPDDLSGNVLTAVRQNVTIVRPVEVPPRRGMVRRGLAAAAVLLLVAGAATAWMLAAGSEIALAQAARDTAGAESARFTFSSDFSVQLRVPDEVREELEGIELPAFEDGLELPEGLDRYLPPAFRDAADSSLEGIRDRLGRLRERVTELIRDGAGSLAEAAPTLRVAVTGDGAYASNDRVRLAGDVRVVEPIRTDASFELVRVGERAFAQAEAAGWKVGMDRLPMKVLRPVSAGLGRLARWIEEQAPGSKRLGRTQLDGAEVERFLLATGPAKPGVTDRIEVWVGVDDRYVHRVLIDHAAERELAVIEGRLDIRLSDHGDQIAIDPPADSEPGDDALFPGRIEAPIGEVDLWVEPDFPGPAIPGVAA